MSQRIKFRNIPVIKLDPEDVIEGMIDQLYPELMIKVLLELDPNDVLNMCATYSRIHTFCDDEYFWKQKTIKDFDDISEGDVPPRGQTWKNFYFNKLNIHRELKQAIRDGNYALVKELAFLLKDEERDDLFEEEFHLSIKENQRKIANYFLENYDIGFTRERGLQIICDLMKQYRSRTITKKVLRIYKTKYNVNFFKLMKCAIDTDDINIVKDIYTSALGTKWRNPKLYIQYAQEQGYYHIAKTIREMYNEYIDWVKTIKKQSPSFFS